MSGPSFERQLIELILYEYGAEYVLEEIDISDIADFLNGRYIAKLDENGEVSFEPKRV